MQALSPVIDKNGDFVAVAVS